MPDVIQLLNEDHREVERMFQEYQETGDPAVVERICEELTVHTQVEEEIVYPVLEDIDREVEEEAEHEHEEAKGLIERIRSLPPDDDETAQLVQQLQEAVQHHVEEEESEAWPKLRDGAGDRLDDLGTRVEQRKQALMASGGASGGAAASAGGGSVPEDATKEELYEKAKEADVPGRSKMDKDELRDAVEQQT